VTGPVTAQDRLEAAAPGEAFLDVLRNLANSLGGVTRILSADLKFRQAERRLTGLTRIAVVPAYAVGTANQTAVIPTPTAPLVLDHGMPQLGRRWLVRNWVVSDGALWTTTCAGSAVLAVGRADFAAGVAHVAPFQVRWATAALPQVATFGSEDVSVSFGEHLYTVITGGTAGQGVQAAAVVQDFALVSTEVVETI
jgi:hypothetical protein